MQGLVVNSPKSQSLISREKAPEGNSQDQRNRELALYHANIVQQRRETEWQILETTEELIDFPPEEDAEPSHPNEANAQRAKNLLQPFQPADYDALIQERNINKHCGYVLCPRQPRSEQSTAKFRILRDKEAGRGGFKIVSREDLEKWCSDSCAKRALYLRVQMLETPAWERKHGTGNELELYHEENQHPEATDLNKLMHGFEQLALERGEASPGSFRTNALQTTLVERSNDGTIRMPAASDPDGNARGRAGDLSADLAKLRLDANTNQDTMETR